MNPFLVTIRKRSKKAEPITISTYWDTPQPIPAAIAQKIYVASLTSFTAVRNLMIERAPTIPRDNAILLLMILMIIAVIIVIVPIEMLNFLLYADPT